MKRKTIFAVALASALALGALVGCSGQSSAPSNTSSSASSTAAQTQDQIMTELKDLVAKAPEYKSVTITEETKTEAVKKDEATTESKDAEAKVQTKEADAKEAEDKDAVSKDAENKDGESVSGAASTIASTAANVAVEAAEKAVSEITGEDNTLTSKTVYKFDASGDKLKTSMEGETSGIKLAYYSYGDDAVVVTDGPVYSGTIEQFGDVHFKGAKAYLDSTIGDLPTLIECASAVEKTEGKAEGEPAVTYTLTLDPKKYTETNEAFKIMAENGEEFTEVKLTLGFDKDGYLVSVCMISEFTGGLRSEVDLTLSDYDKTTVQDMPEATATYDQMDVDIQKKINDFFKDTTDTAEAPAATTAQ